MGHGERGRPNKKLKFSAKDDHRSSAIEDDYSFYPDEGDDEYRDCENEGKKRDFTKLELKQDHGNRPLWACADGRIFLETFSPLYKQAYDFLIAIAEPVCRDALSTSSLLAHLAHVSMLRWGEGWSGGSGVRPESMHEYNLTPHSLYAAVSVGLETETIISVLNKLSKTKLPKEMIDFIHASTANYGKVLKKLLQDEVIGRARIISENAQGSDGFTISKTAGEIESGHGGLLMESELAAVAEEKETHAFEIACCIVENVKQRCLPNALNYPMLEEYDFRNDTVNPDLDMELKPRPYQEKSLSKMFGNGRARSGIIVLPCVAGKSLVGVSAASRIKKSCLCLATNAVSVDHKERFRGNAGVVVTTYNMVAFGGKRSEESEKIIEEIRNREWGLLLMDEVHVVPAHMFRKVISITKSHCKLGLTATLVREDERITDLNFLVGPKLYEANWLDLVKGGFIANVQCAEVWCPMTKEFFAEYLKKENSKKKQVGDNSIDIPEANVIIQISSHAGSRRQEAQRLGRILRAKGKLEDRMVGGKEEYNAFFYSLVSTDTQEMYYSTKRQQFLIDQGYSFKVITSLPPPDAGADLSYYHRDEQLALLGMVLTTGDDAVGLEQLEEDADDIALHKARRSVGSMSTMSGANGMVYMEYSTGKHKLVGQKSRPKDPSKRHHLFKKRFG
ncbi:DNA repair helicase XPB1 [Hibiscus syriacus]|uniref:DNA 3'-5' helicase n=1 Tax=Hibiscus syriacus TaxID=106335 RepID=A0A6A3BYN0_HIBSY|nr:DNA repair helicase XPB1 [Hibiscus syriacus]